MKKIIFLCVFDIGNTSFYLLKTVQDQKTCDRLESAGFSFSRVPKIANRNSIRNKFGICYPYRCDTILNIFDLHNR